jgi:hypothetical protein
VSDAVSERIKANNARFRDANERIRDRADELGVEMERIPFLCECPLEECMEIVHLTPDEYAAVRQNATWFMTAVGHEGAEQPVGEVVARRDGHVVIEKTP